MGLIDVTMGHGGLFASPPAKEEAVVANELAHQQKAVDGRDAVGHDMCNHLALGCRWLWGREVVPQRAYLLALGMDGGLQLILSLLYFFKSLVGHIRKRCNRKMNGDLWVSAHQQVGQEAHQGALDPRLAEDEHQHQQGQEQHGHDEEGQGSACEGLQPIDEGEGEIEEYGDTKDDEHDGEGEGRDKAHHLVDDVQLQVFALKTQVALDGFYQLS